MWNRDRIRDTGYGTHIAYAHARHTHRHTSLRGRSGDLVERMVPPVKGKGRSAIAERDTVELLHGLAQGLHVVRDEVGPTVQYVANKAMKAAARLPDASASWLSRRLPPADLHQLIPSTASAQGHVGLPCRARFRPGHGAARAGARRRAACACSTRERARAARRPARAPGRSRA